MKQVVVLGSGMMGSAIAGDLSKEYSIKIVDINETNLKKATDKYKLISQKVDLSNKKELQDVIKDSDLVICAVPGFMGYDTLKSVIETGKDVVDISFFNQNPFNLDKLAIEKKVTAIVDCGIAPGLSNIVLGYYNKKMEIANYKCMVGGLPVERQWPFEYKAPFSPIDIIEEYMRPSRIIEHGKIIIKPALSEPELIEFKGIGKLEAFNTDGLRSLLMTTKIPNMIEKTLRYPKHIEYIKVLKECGFFETNEIDIRGNKIRPIDVMTKLLFPLWKLEVGEDEFTVLRFIISGKENNKPKSYTYTLIDRYDHKNDITSMARTTGFTCSSASRLLLNNKFKRKGICPPEFIGEDVNCYNNVLDDLGKRGLNFNVKQE